MGSVRVVLNSTNTVISANDYDCWGYPLENRTYQPENSKYKFTGKERDKDLENNYDYFGARYYDSRIGRWGGVEPLLDKYPGVTPYCYSQLNPIKFIDVNGKDGIVTIEGNKITITSSFYYSSEGSFGFNTTETENFFKSSMEDAAQLWTDAGKNIEFEGKKYDVEFKADFIEVSSEQISQMWSDQKSIPSGMNIAYLSNKAKEPGVKNGNALRIVPEIQSVTPEQTYYRDFFAFWSSHELGHLLGLNHEPKETYDVMSYNKDRNSPSKENIIKVLGKIDINKGQQAIKGVKGE